jgi:adenylosuccinate synthase
MLASDFESRYKAIKTKHLGLVNLYPHIDFDLEGEEERFFTSIERIRNLRYINSEYFINNALNDGKKF